MATCSDRDFAVRFDKRMRQNLTQLHSRASDDVVGFVFRASQPADVFAALEDTMNLVPRFGAKRLEQVRRKLPHVLKHACAMPADDFDIRNGSQSDTELGHSAINTAV